MNKERDELIERTRAFYLQHHANVAPKDIEVPALIADFALAETKQLREIVEKADESVRYALATFRTLDQYTFEDSDHGLLIAEAVKKLEENQPK